MIAAPQASSRSHGPGPASSLRRLDWRQCPVGPQSQQRRGSGPVGLARDNLLMDLATDTEPGPGVEEGAGPRSLAKHFTFRHWFSLTRPRLRPAPPPGTLQGFGVLQLVLGPARRMHAPRPGEPGGCPRCLVGSFLSFFKKKIIKQVDLSCGPAGCLGVAGWRAPRWRVPTAEDLEGWAS